MLYAEKMEILITTSDDSIDCIGGFIKELNKYLHLATSDSYSKNNASVHRYNMLLTIKEIFCLASTHLYFVYGYDRGWCEGCWLWQGGLNNLITSCVTNTRSDMQYRTITSHLGHQGKYLYPAKAATL